MQPYPGKTKVRRMSVAMQSAPINRGPLVRSGAPQMIGTARGLTISHTEPINFQQMIAAGALNYYTQALIPSFFPYLNGIAANFGKWKWQKLTIFYVPSCPSTTAGEAAFGLYYDRLDAVAATFLQTCALDRAVSYSPWLGSTSTGSGNPSIEVDTTRFEKPYYSYVTVTSFNSAAVNDQTALCPVSYASATQGSTAALALSGRIWCRYTIALLDPIPPGINA